VSRDTKYSTPFSYGDQDLQRVMLTDVWTVSPNLTVNNRVSFLHRDVEILRNSGGTVVGTSLTARQLREQTDHVDDLNYQFEPVWKFATGQIGHTLVTGFQAQRQLISDNRATADLPNIANIFAPVIPETSTSGLAFLRDAKHSGMVDDLAATYLGIYAVDQMDIGSRLKLRLSVRKDWWDTDLTPEVFVPGRLQPDGTLFEPGVTQSRFDKPVSWSAGALYKLFPGVSPFIGASRSYLTNFNSEATQQGIVAPESALQYETGVKTALLDNRVTITTALFKIARTNVFTEVGNQIFFNDQETRGVEVDVQLKPTTRWKIETNYTFQDAVLTNQPSAPATNGNHPIGIPAHIFNLWSTYDFAIAGVNGFKIGAGVSYNDRTFGNAQNTNWIPASTVYNTVLSYSEARWDVALGIKNLTDVTYYTTALSAGGAVGEPRTVFAKANYHW
jgi:iron complex outermembrane recepter protein